VSVGKPRERDASALHDRYAERIRRFGVAYRSSWVADVPGGARFSDAHARQREGSSLLKRWDRRGTLVSLDRSGRRLSSRGFAAELETWATPRLTLFVGGPTGLDMGVLEASTHRLSLSSLTLPHELVRALIAEQVYRALTLLRGVPYHR